MQNIGPEFQGKILPLTPEEYRLLEEKILDECKPEFKKSPAAPCNI